MDMLREVQLKELEILREVKRICEKHGIPYFLACGTLLGAVRHQGFIPWDDDVDLMMPRLDGLQACMRIREFSNVPVIMLTARGEEYDKLFGFEIGIDDYVVKPFSPKEVMARVNAIVKRNQGAKQAPAAPAPETVKFGGLEINFTSRDVYIDGVKANLTPKEYDLLFYLVRNKNIALTRNKLLEEVWGYDFFGDDRTIDTHIKMLRNNLGPYRNYIVTLRGMGYKFEAD